MTTPKPRPTIVHGEAHAYPVLPLRDIVVFPHNIVPLFVGREKSIRALEEDGSVTCETLKLPRTNRGRWRPGNQPPTRRRHGGCADGRPSKGAPRRTSPVPMGRHV